MYIVNADTKVREHQAPRQREAHLHQQSCKTTPGPRKALDEAPLRTQQEFLVRKRGEVPCQEPIMQPTASGPLSVSPCSHTGGLLVLAGPRIRTPALASPVPPLDQPLTTPSCPSLSPRPGAIRQRLGRVPTLRFAPLFSLAGANMRHTRLCPVGRHDGTTPPALR